MRKDNNLLTSKDHEIMRLSSQLKVVDSKAYDIDGNAVNCIETLSGLSYTIEPNEGVLSDDEILKYAPESKAAAKLRIKREIADIDDFNLAYNSLAWKLASYYIVMLMILPPVLYIRNALLIIIVLILMILPIYFIRNVLKIRTNIKLRGFNNNHSSITTNVSSLVKYETEIIELKEEFLNKKTNVEDLIERRFAPPQLTYDKFMSTVENTQRVFDSESENALIMVRFVNEYSEDVEEQIKARIKTLKIFINQIDNLSNELALNLSENDESDDEISSIIEEMDRLIDSVNKYE